MSVRRATPQQAPPPSDRLQHVLAIGAQARAPQQRRSLPVDEPVCAVRKPVHRASSADAGPWNVDEPVYAVRKPVHRASSADTGPWKHAGLPEGIPVGTPWQFGSEADVLYATIFASDWEGSMEGTVLFEAIRNSINKEEDASNVPYKVFLGDCTDVHGRSNEVVEYIDKNFDKTVVGNRDANTIRWREIAELGSDLRSQEELYEQSGQVYTPDDYKLLCDVLASKTYTPQDAAVKAYWMHTSTRTTYNSGKPDYVHLGQSLAYDKEKLGATLRGPSNVDANRYLDNLHAYYKKSKALFAKYEKHIKARLKRKNDLFPVDPRGATNSIEVAIGTLDKVASTRIDDDDGARRGMLKDMISRTNVPMSHAFWTAQRETWHPDVFEDLVKIAMKQNVLALEHASDKLKANRDVVLAAVQKNGLALEHASDELKVDGKVVRAAVEQNGLALKHAPKLREDKEVVLAAVAQDGLALQHTSDKLKANPEVVLAAVKKSGLALQHAAGYLKMNREVVLAAVAQDGLALQHTSPKLREDKEVVLAAVAQDGLVLEHASPELRADREVVLAAVRQNGFALEFVPNKLKNDRDAVGPDDGYQQSATSPCSECLAVYNSKPFAELVLAAVQQDGMALKFAGAYFWRTLSARKDAVAYQMDADDKRMVLAAVRQNGLALQFVPDELKANREVVLAAVEKDGLALQHASPERKADGKVVLVAVQKDGLALKHASVGLRANKDLVLTAVKKSGLALKHASVGLRKDKKVVLAAVKKSGLALQHAPKLNADKEVVLAAVAQDGLALQHAFSELREDQKVVLAAVEQNGLALEHALGDLNSSPTVVPAAMGQDGLALKFASTELQKKDEYVLEAIENAGYKVFCIEECAKLALRNAWPKPSHAWSLALRASDEKAEHEDAIEAFVLLAGVNYQILDIAKGLDYYDSTSYCERNKQWGSLMSQYLQSSKTQLVGKRHSAMYAHAGFAGKSKLWKASDANNSMSPLGMVHHTPGELELSEPLKIRPVPVPTDGGRAASIENWCTAVNKAYSGVVSKIESSTGCAKAVALLGWPGAGVAHYVRPFDYCEHIAKMVSTDRPRYCVLGHMPRPWGRQHTCKYEVSNPGQLSQDDAEKFVTLLEIDAQYTRYCEVTACVYDSDGAKAAQPTGAEASDDQKRAIVSAIAEQLPLFYSVANASATFNVWALGLVTADTKDAKLVYRVVCVANGYDKLLLLVPAAPADTRESVFPLVSHSRLTTATIVEIKTDTTKEEWEKNIVVCTELGAKDVNPYNDTKFTAIMQKANLDDGILQFDTKSANTKTATLIVHTYSYDKYATQLMDGNAFKKLYLQTPVADAQ